MKVYDKPVDILMLDEDAEIYKDLLHLHAQVNRAAETERLSAGSERDAVTLTFELRYCKAVRDISYNTENYRIRYKGMLFNIVAADDYMEGHKTLKLTGVKL